MAEDLSPQLKIQQQINATLVERTNLFNAHTKILATQLDLAVKIRDVLRGEGLREAEKASKDVLAALDEATDAAQRTAGGMSDLGAAASDAADEMEKTKKPLISTKQLFGALFDSIGAGISTVMNFGSSIFNVASSLGKLGLAILSVPFKMFDSFIETAQTLPRNTAIRDALEDIRDAFGDIATSSGKAVASQLGKIQNQARDLAGTGLSVTRAFGFGAEGIAGALKAVNELAKGTGEAFTRLKGVFKASGLQLTMMQMGLGLSAEAMGKLMNLAELRGKDVAGTMASFSMIAISTAKSFNIDVKAMAHGMEELNVDVDTFGHLGPKAFAPMVVFAKKLGIEVKQLAGTMKKFSGFSDTAKAASELAQGFGLNVDAMRLMAAQNPAQKIDILREAFFAAGKDLSKMSYQQRQYLSQTTGLEGAALEAAFSLDKQALSYENIEKKAQVAAKQQKTQSQVMAELGKQIKKLNHLMDVEKYSGFFDAFVKGFGVGLLKAGELRGVLYDMRTALYRIHLAGREVARIFVKEFPGVKDMLQAVNDFFNPTRFEKFATRLVKTFKALFKGEIEWGEFFKRMGDLFTEQTGPGGDLFVKVKEGFEKFATFLMKGVGSAITFAANKLADDVLPAIQEFLDDLTKEMAKEESKGKGFLSVLFQRVKKGDISKKLGPMMEPLLSSLQDVFVKLAPKFKKMFETIWPMIKPYLVQGTAVLAGVFALGFVKSVAGTLAGVGIAALGKSIKNMIVGGAETKDVEKGTARVAVKMSERLSNATNTAMNKFDNTTIGRKILVSFEKLAATFGPKIAASGTKLVPVVGWILAIADASVQISAQMNKMEGQLRKDYGKMEGTIGAGAAGLLSALTLNLLPDTVYESFGELMAATQKSLKEFAKKIGLENIFAHFQRQMKSSIQILQGVGDILVGIFTLSGDKILKGFNSLGKGLLVALMQIPSLFGSMMLDLVPLAIKSFLRVTEWMYFDLPGLIFDALNSLFKKMGNFFSSDDKTQMIKESFLDLFGSPLQAIKEKGTEMLTWLETFGKRILLKLKLNAAKVDLLVFSWTKKGKAEASANIRFLENQIKDLENTSEEANKIAAKKKAAAIAKEASVTSLTDITGKRGFMGGLDVIQKQFDKNNEKLAEAERKRQEKIGAAHHMVTMIEDVESLQAKLKESMKKLDAIKVKDIKAKLLKVSKKLMSILSEIPNTLNESKLSTVQSETQKRITDYTTALNTAFGPILRLSDSLAEISRKFDSIKSSTNSVMKTLHSAPFTKVTAYLKKNHLQDMIVELNNIAQLRVDNSTALGTDGLAKILPVAQALQNFKGGEISVSHNLPNTKIELTVNIDSKELGRQLLAVDLGKNPRDDSKNGPTYTKIYQATTDTQTKIPG